LIKEFLMKHKRAPIPVIVILILALFIGGYFGIRALTNKSTTALTASGTIETVEVNIAPEIGGKVSGVLVDEGTQVKAGDVLFKLDDTLLQAQRAVAAATLEAAQAATTTATAAVATAQANYDLAVNAARSASAAARLADWRAPDPSGYTLPGGYFSQADEIAAAQAEVDTATSDLTATRENLNTLLADQVNASFVAAEQRLSDARATSLVSQDVLARAKAADNSDLSASAQSAADDAKTELEDAQSLYDSLKDTEGAVNIINARADLSAAQERLYSAQDRLLALQYGDDSPQVAAAQAVLRQAQAAADQATVAVKQAEASLNMINVQIVKLTVSAPVDGTILTSALQPGEIVAPNSVAMTLGRLDTLTITVYVPEDLYGELSLGQQANMTVDSFPGETFNAVIIHIADQAEFTPRNVQTVEGRSSTVFAIKLQVQDPGGKLKPGMPADVEFR
jgi:HlyD family secretion protein